MLNITNIYALFDMLINKLNKLNMLNISHILNMFYIFNVFDMLNLFDIFNISDIDRHPRDQNSLFISDDHNNRYDHMNRSNFDLHNSSYLYTD